MKKIKLFTAFILLCTVITFAQQKKYIPYEVKQNETLKSIAQDYDLSTKDLSRLNPDVSRKPVMGTIIIVPNKYFGKASTTIVGEDKKVDTNKENFYVVQPKETLYGISKKHEITIEALQKANPQLVNGLQPGMKLTIPKTINAELANDDEYELHTVVKDNTIYNLTKRYGVSEAELYSLNPALKDGLKLGMVLKIKPLKTIENNEVVKNDKLFVNTSNKAVFIEQLNFKKEINVAIILPYQINSLNDSLLDQSFAKNNLLNIATDFHMGSKMAIDSLKSKGLKLNVSYFDSENSEQKMQVLLSRNQNFNNKDLIIGPLFFDNAYLVSKRSNTPVLVPIYSKKQETLNHQNLIKTTPNTVNFQQKLLYYLEENYNGENIVIVNDGLSETQTQLWQIVNKIKTFENIKTVSVVKPENGYINRTVFNSKISPETKNWVIIVSEDNVTTSGTINGLKGVPESTEIRLFAINKGKNFDTIDNIFLGKMNFTFSTAEFIDTDDLVIINFYKAYFAKNNAFPSKYALRGFDTTYDAIVRLASANSFEEGLNAGMSTRLAGVFEYANNSFGNVENKGLFLIQYNADLTVEIIE